MYYRKALFLCIPKYFYIQISSFKENAKTKVYALEDTLGLLYIYFLANLFTKYLFLEQLPLPV